MTRPGRARWPATRRVAVLLPASMFGVRAKALHRRRDRRGAARQEHAVRRDPWIARFRSQARQYLGRDKPEGTLDGPLNACRHGVSRRDRKTRGLPVPAAARSQTATADAVSR